MARPAESLGHHPRGAQGIAVSDPRYTVADIPSNVLLYLSQQALRRGLACDSWFAGLGLQRSQLSDPSLRVSSRQASTVIRRALRTFPEADIGLLIGYSETPGSFGLLGLAMTTARTFGDAMRVGIEHHKVCGALLDVTFEAIDAREVALMVWPRFGETALLPFLCEELFASSLVMARQLLGPTFRPAGLDLTYPAPTYAPAYESIFQCPVRFGAQCNRVRVDSRWLQQELAGHNPLTARQALALCAQQEYAGGARQEIVVAVERLLRSRLRQPPTVGEIARTLNLSERSLRRQLAGNGRVFREIHDRVRAELALELLQAGSLSVAQVGGEVGFNDPREFRRAFKRWTGMAPQEARLSVS